MVHMKRVMTVVLMAVLTAYVSGVDNTTWAAEALVQDTPQRVAHRQALVEQLQKVKAGTPIEVERATGEKIKAVFQNVTADAITVILPGGGRGVPQTIALDEITRIKKLGGHLARNVLIGVGVAVAALVGVCAAAASKA
jgi:hypothetical protein